MAGLNLNNVDVVYQHQDFYVVHKPADIGFHDEKQQQGNELITGFFNLCQQVLNQDLYPVHRLDKLTSGLLILARNKTAATWFQQAFEQKQIEKLYLALSSSKPKKKQGSVIGDMVKARNSQWKLIKSNQSPAITRFFSWGLETELSGCRLFLIKPETGKTHQIRVALKSLGSPIIGDSLYQGIDADRGYLHAYGLKFNYLDEPIELFQAPQQGQLFIDHWSQITTKLDAPFALNWPVKK